MSGLTDIMTVMLVLVGGYILMKSGKLEEIMQSLSQGQLSLPPLPGLPKPPAPTAPAPAPAPAAPSGGGGGGGPSSVTGTNIYRVVGNIQSGGEVTLRGGGTSNRDNIGYPCNKCARESTWIFRPGSGGDWSLKLGSHGDEGGKETLIELGNIDTNGGGGEWRCEGPHMTYNNVTGGSGKAPAIGGRARVGAKAVTWPLGGNRIHHEIYMDMTGAGNNWQKIAQFDGAATGCNAITCPVPGGKCQDTLRLDNVKGHQFISRSVVEIVPGAGAVGGGSGGSGSGGTVRTIGGGGGSGSSSAPAPTTAKRTIGAVRAAPAVAPRSTTIIKGYECFDQREDNILVHCCRYKTKPPEEAHCKSTLEINEYLKCCRDDKKAWANLW